MRPGWVVHQQGSRTALSHVGSLSSVPSRLRSPVHLLPHRWSASQPAAASSSAEGPSSKAQHKAAQEQAPSKATEGPSRTTKSSTSRAPASPQRTAEQLSHAAWPQPKVTLSVEGNISVGKSTFLSRLQAAEALQGKLQIVPEPVAKWQCVGEGQVNLLMEFYKAPERFAYTFQNYVFLTRVVQERESYISPEPCRLLERSIFCDRQVFVRACHAAKFMNDTELSIYDAWFDPILNTLPTLVPNGFIYLRAQPEVCHHRLQLRGRQEENAVQLGYLQELHQCHEDWLFNGGEPVTATSSGQLYIWVGPSEQVLQGTNRASAAVNAATSARPKISYAVRSCLPGPELTDVVAMQVPKVPRSLSGAIRFIDANRTHIHPLLDTIPSLVIDCNSEVDVQHDLQYQEFVGRMVQEFSEYVRAYMLARGDARIALENHFASKAESAAAAMPNEAPAQGPGLPLPADYNGYTINVGGTTLYMDPEAPLLAYATERASHKRTRRGPRIYYPNTPRTAKQQGAVFASQAGQGGAMSESGEQGWSEQQGVYLSEVGDGEEMEEGEEEFVVAQEGVSMQQQQQQQQQQQRQRAQGEGVLSGAD